MLKKISKILLVSTLCLSITACSGTESSTSTDNKNGDKVTLKFMYWGSAFEKKAIENMVQDFEKDHPKIDIDAQYVPNADYETKINTLMASDNLPDIAYVTEGLALKWAEQGKVMDVAPYLEQYPQLKNRMPETFYYYDEGKTLGTNTAGEIMNIFYNKELFKQAKVDAPPSKAEEAWNWEQFIKVAQQLTLDNKNRNAADPNFDPKNIVQYGISFPTWWAGWFPFLTSNGGAITNEDGTKYTLNSPEAVEVFQNIQDLIYKYHVAPSPTQQKTMPSSSVVLQTKKVAMVLDGHWNVLDFGNSKLNYGIGVLPKYEKSTTTIFGGPTVIFKSTKHPKEAMEFYLYHNDPEKVDLFAKGLWMPLENKYYTEPEFIDKWTKNEVHPPEFKEAVVDYTLNNSVPGPVYSLKNWAEIEKVLIPAFDQIWLGKKSAQEVLDGLEAKVQPLLKGKYPRPEK